MQSKISWDKWNKYKRKTIVVLKYMDDMPVFGEIVKIFVTPIGECHEDTSYSLLLRSSSLHWQL